MPEKPIVWVGCALTDLKKFRIHTRMEFRVFYVARFQEAVYVLHAFEKKSAKTSMRDIRIGRARFAEVIATRANQELP